MSRRWSALDAARLQSVPRVAWCIDGRRVGSVATAHLPALAAWPRWFARRGDAVHLMVGAAERNAALTEVHQRLREQGLILAWRDETYPVLTRLGEPPLALIERAAARFWGTLTFGAHCNGYVAGAQGRPTHLWIARRAWTKATDPGKLDNLVGGGVPHGQTPAETLVREGFEEAGLDANTMARAQAGSVIELACDIAEGFMHERLHVFDLCLDKDMAPKNRDGEVAEWHRLTVDAALALAAGGEMTTDAALVTLDFALRHHLLRGNEPQTLASRMADLLFVG